MPNGNKHPLLCIENAIERGNNDREIKNINDQTRNFIDYPISFLIDG